MTMHRTTMLKQELLKALASFEGLIRFGRLARTLVHNHSF
jgi:hypothetical protein